MKAIGQLFLGLFSAIASSAIVLAAISLALIEGKVQVIPPVTTPTSPAETAAPGLLPIENTPVVIIATATFSCKFPPGWVPHTILAGETLSGLAKETGIKTEELYAKNCLESDSLQIGAQLYLPPATATPTVTNTSPVKEEPPEEATATKNEPQRCIPPARWVPYVLKPGDYLSRLARAFGTSVEQIKAANCLTSDDVQAGQRLYLPNVATRVPTSTPQPTETPRPPATQPPPTKTPEPTFTEAFTLTVAPFITETVSTTITVAPKETANPNPQPVPSNEPTQ